MPKTVADISSRQRDDGGFGLWPGSTVSYPWVSAYALFVLSQAHQHGLVVPAGLFDRGRNYLRHYLADTTERPERLPTAAFVADVLADMGTPDFGYMQQLFDRRKELPLFAKALLAHALAASKSPDRKPKELLQKLLPDLENALRIDHDQAFVAENLGDEYAVLMDSPARTAALVLRALMAAKPDHPLGSELARGLLAARVNGTWRTTQETAYALIALDAYRKAQEKIVPDFQVRALLGQTTVMDVGMHGRKLSATHANLAIANVVGASGAALVFDKVGSGTLFYQARLRYARRTLPVDSLDQGFYVQKSLTALSPEALGRIGSGIPETSTQHFKGGDLALVDLVIVTPSPRQFVVVDDPLPAGFEAVDSHLATTSQALDVGEASGEPCAECEDDEGRDQLAAGQMAFENYTRRELRDDRVLYFVDHMVAGMYHYRYLARASTFGQFVLPSTRVEEMYTPETFGRNGATLVTVE